MYKSTLPTRRAVADIIFAYRHVQGVGGKPLSLRDFANALSEILEPFSSRISHQAVKNWEDRAHVPRVVNMMLLLLYAPKDWRRDFGQDILSILRSDLYQPATQIGQRAKERSLIDTGPHKSRYDRYFVQS